MNKIRMAALVLSIGLCAKGSPGPSDRLLTAEIRGAVRQALDELNMTETDTEFDRDHGEPRLVLPTCRAALRSHEALAGAADSALAAACDQDPLAVWRQAGAWLGTVQGRGRSPVSVDVPLQAASLAPPLKAALQAFLNCAIQVNGLVCESRKRLPDNDKEELVSSCLTDLLNVEEDADAFRSLVAAGVSSQQVARAILASQSLDPKADTERYLNGVERVDVGCLCEAGIELATACRRLAEVCAAVREWPKVPERIGTPLGPIVVGTMADDVHADWAFLVLDPGGNDTYGGCAGTANGLRGRPVGAVIDLQGNDLYRSDQLCGAGAAILGACAVLDYAGDDVYRAAYLGQAASAFGSSWMEDESGSDQYTARVMSQAAAVCGVAVLRDRAGNDLYQAGHYAQAFAGTRGVGWLVEESGNDRYFVGGEEPDYERHAHRFLSFGQGTSLGMRPGAGGGIGVLNELGGNDVYVSDVYGQGVGYWYSIGMLLDSGGHDSYQVYEYGQGTGIHLSAGVLYDREGNDLYSGFSLSQGSAHDFAVGLLVDAAGDDTYTADHFSQGRAINNSLALLLDRNGKDAYFARQNGECQAMGHWNGDRSMASLSLLADLGGDDLYSSGASNEAVTIKPDVGAVFDSTVSPSEGKAAESPGNSGLIRWSGGLLAVTNATLDQLMFHASRYGCTEERRNNKRNAVAEMKRRGPIALRYLVASAESENIWFSIYARQFVEEADAQDSAAVLLEFLGDKSKDVRKTAALLLGFCKTPQFAERVRPLLDDPDACGAVIRTLGAWKDSTSAARIAQFLRDPNERRRSQAATALAEIGALDSVPELVGALGDSSGIVRAAALRSLLRFSADVAGPRLLDAMPRSQEVQRRQIVRALGEIRWKPAMRPLKSLLAANPDASLRSDVAAALWKIQQKDSVP